jgi:GNAT superfamily N-acetyltransferase
VTAVDPDADETDTGSEDARRVTIRQYRPGDHDAVLSLHERALAETGTDPDDVPGTADLDAIPETYLAAGGEFLVAEREGAIVGMGGLKVDGDSGELFRMRVDPAIQRSAIGSRLLAALEAAARERGVKRLRAETARRQTAATQFYPANGYRERGRSTYGDYELIRFEKRL